MDAQNYIKFAAAFAFVMGLMFLLAHVARHFHLAERFAKRGNAPRRLKTVEFLSIDARRKLVIVKRDNVEHLLLLGVDGETVVETNISQSACREDIEINIERFRA